MEKLSALISAIVFLAAFGIGEVVAVDAPSAKNRQKAEAWHKKEIKEKVKEDRASGCEYGRDKTTGRCYEPKEGQFYRDPKTGKMKVKKIEKINTPW